MDRTICSVGFFFNDTATTEIYTFSLHDALPICVSIPHQLDGASHLGIETGCSNVHRSEEHTSELQSLRHLVCRLLLEKIIQDKEFTAAQAATIILDVERSGAWRILFGEEAKMLDAAVRANPEAPFIYYKYAETHGPLIALPQADAEAS